MGSGAHKCAEMDNKCRKSSSHTQSQVRPAVCVLDTESCALCGSQWLSRWSSRPQEELLLEAGGPGRGADQPPEEIWTCECSLGVKRCRNVNCKPKHLEKTRQNWASTACAPGNSHTPRAQSSLVVLIEVCGIGSLQTAVPT